MGDLGEESFLEASRVRAISRIRRSGSSLYGIERATADVDIIIKLVNANLRNFIDAVKRLGLKPKIPVRLDDFLDAEKRKEWAKEKGMMVFSLYDVKNPFFLLDIFVEIPFDFDAVYKRRKMIKFEDKGIPVVPIKELIRMKKIVGAWEDEK